MIKDIVLRLLNGVQIKYGLRDLLTFLKFVLTPPNSISPSNISSSELKMQVVVISLPFRLDRRSQIIEQFKNLEIPFEFFDAIHGKSERMKAFQVVEFSSMSKTFLSPGSIGCIASHISVWKNLSTSSYDSFLISEDDIIFEKEFTALKRFLNQLPNDADIVYLGSGAEKGWINMKKVSDNLARPFSVRKGAYSYLLFKKGAIKLLDEVNRVKIVCGGVDSILGILGMRNRLTVYHFMPPICRVNYSSPSNIINLSDRSKFVQEKEFK